MSKTIERAKLEGIASLTVTALNDDFTINEKANEAEIDWLIERKANSLWFRGFIGEWPQLDLEISKNLIKVYADHAKGRTILAAGCHGDRPSECIELANYADKMGCDLAWMLAPPHPASANEDSIYLFYRTIIENTSIPLAIYNSAAMFIYMSPHILNNIIDMAPDRFVSIKDSYGINSHQTEILRCGVADRVAYFFMSSEMILPVVLGNKHIMCMPHQLPMAWACYAAVQNNDIQQALKYQQRLIEGAALLGLTSMVLKPLVKGNPNMFGGSAKAVVSEYLGIEMGPPAPPIPRATKEELKAAKECVAKWNLLDLDAPVPTD